MPDLRRSFRLFDRRVWSQRPLRLLLEVDNAQPPVASDVVVEWSDDTLSLPEGSTTVMDSAWFTTHRLPQRYVFDVHHAQIRVDISEDGRQLCVHPLSHESSTSGVDPADAIVTNVLSRLPSLWGDLPVHSACLDVGSGLLLLCAVSGTGKSTLSQLLARRRGWTILDDDTSVVRVHDDEMKLLPMGARSRVRMDAAAELDLVGEPLHGYAGGKQMLDFVVFDPERIRSLNVTAVVHVLALPADAEGCEPLSITQGNATEGMVSLARSTTAIDPLAATYRAALMGAGSRLASCPTTLVAYQRDSVSAVEVASAIESLVDLLDSGSTDGRILT